MAKKRVRPLKPRRPPGVDGLSASAPSNNMTVKPVLPDDDMADYFPEDKFVPPAPAPADVVATARPSRAAPTAPIDGVLVGVRDKGRKKYGDTAVYVGSETDGLVVGVPMFAGNGPDALEFPGCLPVEYVIGQDAFPLCVIYQLVGKTGIGKSALLAEFGRWFDLLGGGLSLKGVESKFNPKWYRSIMGHEAFDRRVLYYPCDSVEDWQRMLTFSIKEVQASMLGTKKAPGPGRAFPVLFGVDSIMGKQSEETQEKIVGKERQDGRPGTTGAGHATRGHPLEAQLITRYMRTVSNLMDGWPFALALVNQLRVRADEQGFTQRVKAGGEQVDFQESFELELAKVGGHKKRIEGVEFDGFPVSLSCEKNSLGPTHRRIVTRLLWWDEEDVLRPGAWVQRTVWDWDWSTVHLLDNLLNGERSSPRMRAALKDAEFHLECTKRGDIDNRAWSKSLGMSASAAVSWSKLGAMIRGDSVLMARLRAALCISHLPVMTGDYLAAISKRSKELP